MISQANASPLSTTYTANSARSKESAVGMMVSKQGDTSKIDKIKESLSLGEYKVDLDALSQKIADELL